MTTINGTTITAQALKNEGPCTCTVRVMPMNLSGATRVV
jgi:hypothetical protein